MSPDAIWDDEADRMVVEQATYTGGLRYNAFARVLRLAPSPRDVRYPCWRLPKHRPPAEWSPKLRE